MKQYNFNGLAGCVSQARSRRTGTVVSIYRNDQAIGRWWGLDEAPGPWATVCERHSTVTGHATLTLAKDFSTTPDDWCEECQT